MRKALIWNFLAGLLIIAVFLLQYSSELILFKYWISLVIVIAASLIIVYNTYIEGSQLSKKEKENKALSQELEEVQTRLKAFEKKQNSEASNKSIDPNINNNLKE